MVQENARAELEKHLQWLLHTGTDIHRRGVWKTVAQTEGTSVAYSVVIEEKSQDEIATVGVYRPYKVPFSKCMEYARTNRTGRYITAFSPKYTHQMLLFMQFLIDNVSDEILQEGLKLWKIREQSSQHTSQS